MSNLHHFYRTINNKGQIVECTSRQQFINNPIGNAHALINKNNPISPGWVLRKNLWKGFKA